MADKVSINQIELVDQRLNRCQVDTKLGITMCWSKAAIGRAQQLLIKLFTLLNQKHIDLRLVIDLFKQLLYILSKQTPEMPTK